MAIRDKIEHEIQQQPCTVKHLKEKFGGATPAETVKNMLLPGEIEDLSRAVERLCGYRMLTIEEVKNG